VVGAGAQQEPVEHVARPGDDEGLLPVQLKVTGPHGFPCGGRQVNAYWEWSSGHAATAGHSSSCRTGRPWP